jgi:hypothetical protein
VLLDACIVIEAYKIGVWKKLIEKVEIIVSSIVAHKESLFHVHEQKREIREPINLKHLIKSGKIKEMSATLKEMAEFSNKFDRLFVSGLHTGKLNLYL